MNLKNYFVTKEQAESLKELGFNEECLAYYIYTGELILKQVNTPGGVGAALIAQAIDWLSNELGHTVTDVDNGIDSGIKALKAIRKRINVTVNFSFEVYQKGKTYEDGNYLIVQEDEDYPTSVTIMYGEMIGNDGFKFNDDDIAYISHSFILVR
jgi:hypothetical protein